MPPSQAVNGSNRWISSTLPASLSLMLAQPVAIVQAELTFDTGMHRKLSFSPGKTPPTDGENWGCVHGTAPVPPGHLHRLSHSEP